MKKLKNVNIIHFVLLVLFCCAEEVPESEVQDHLTLSQSHEQKAGARANLSGEDIAHDWSGQIESLTIWADVDDGEINNGELTLPSDYVLVGGGAKVVDAFAGAYLTENRPDWPNNKWVAASKSHIDPDSHILQVWAVGIKFQGVTAETLRGVMTHTVSSPSSLTSQPTNTALIDPPLKMVGGGAKVNNPTTDWGNMLYQSYPYTPQGWSVRSKDHIYADPATITAYAIGMPENIPGFGYIDIHIFTNSNYVSTYKNRVNGIVFGGEYVATCIGAQEVFSGYGRMLMEMKPPGLTPYYGEIPNAYSTSKDHRKASSGTLTTYSVQIRKRH